MHELAILAVVVALVMAVDGGRGRSVGRALLVMEYVLVSVSVLVILFVMAFVGAEVFMRYALNSPIPGHLELSELMMPVIVFLALSYTQSTHGHVGMELVLDALAAGRAAALATWPCCSSASSSARCSPISASSTRYQLWLYDDVTMSPPYFKTWPSAAAIPLGYALISLRMFIQVLHIFDPGRFPASEPAPALFTRPNRMPSEMATFTIVTTGRAVEPISLGILSLVALSLFLASGMRIAFATAICGFFGLWILRGYDPAATLSATTIVGHITNYNLLVLPLFIMMGFFAYYAGITRISTGRRGNGSGICPAGLRSRPSSAARDSRRLAAPRPHRRR